MKEIVDLAYNAVMIPNGIHPDSKEARQVRRIMKKKSLRPLKRCFCALLRTRWLQFGISRTTQVNGYVYSKIGQEVHGGGKDYGPVCSGRDLQVK